MNAIYLIAYFLGGALGSLLGSVGWSLVGWNGVNIVACALLLFALGFFFAKRQKRVHFHDTKEV